MEWNIYKDWLDPVLYRQMVSMIYQLSSNADKEAFLKQERENSLFYGICEHSMEEEYNLHYPGEVLERMKAVSYTHLFKYKSTDGNGSKGDVFSGKKDSRVFSDCG